MTSEAPDRPYAGRLEADAHRFAIRVYYEDTDAGGVVYHARFLHFCERARSDLLAIIGIDQAAALAGGEGGFVVAHLDIRYRAPARLGDALVVESRLEKIGRSSLVIQQGVRRDRQEVAAVRVTVAFVGADGRPRGLPAAWIAALQAIGSLPPAL